MWAMSRENQVQTFRFPLAMEFHGDMLNSPSNDGGQHVQSTVHRGAHPNHMLQNSVFNPDIHWPHSLVGYLIMTLNIYMDNTLESDFPEN